ncbi:MAG: zinc ABC transporter substrate-binding protein [Ndongobacter sp.]|nr:zinc ABC transporter substrate-binding protein [Ndongobacter sp.]
MEIRFSLRRLLRRLGLIIATLLLLAVLHGCAPDISPAGSKDAVPAKKQVTVTTSFLADMVRVLAGDFVDIQLLIPAGEDPHQYVAKPQDFQKIESADLVLYHGLHFEGKMIEILEKLGKSVSAHFPADRIGTMDEEGEGIIDPHFWFDIFLYKAAVTEAAEQLSLLLPEHADAIRTRRDQYLTELTDLDAEIREKISSIPLEQRFLVTPHDAFNYFSRAYNIAVVAPQGVSTDSETSNADIDRTVAFIVQHKIKAVFSESTTNPERMQKLKEICLAKGWPIDVVEGEGRELFSDSLAPQGHDGDTYLSMYRHNVDLIVTYLR